MRTCQELLPGPTQPMDVSPIYGDAELFESAFLPLPVDGLHSLGDLWHDATWHHLYMKKENLYDVLDGFQKVSSLNISDISLSPRPKFQRS